MEQEGCAETPGRMDITMKAVREQADKLPPNCKCYTLGGCVCFILLVIAVVVAGSWVVLDVKDVALAYETLNPYLRETTFPGPGRCCGRDMDLGCGRFGFVYPLLSSLAGFMEVRGIVLQGVI